MPSLSIHSFPGGPSKQNIGHIEGGSGLAAIVKGILMLEKGIIPPVALFEKLNLNIDADFYNLQVQLPYSQPRDFCLICYQIPTQSIPWPTDGLRRISINSFGLGGANVHILDDAFNHLQEHGLSGFHHCDTSAGHAHGTVTNVAATNRHVVNGTSANQASDEQSTPRLLIWSAADAGATDRMLQAYQSYYQTHTTDDHRKLNQLAYLP